MVFLYNAFVIPLRYVFPFAETERYYHPIITYPIVVKGNEGLDLPSKQPCTLIGFRRFPPLSPYYLEVLFITIINLF